MKQCYNCNTSNTDEAFYCKKCGSNIDIVREQHFKCLEQQKQEEKRLKIENSIKQQKMGGILALAICIAPIVLLILAAAIGNTTLLGLTLLGISFLIFFIMASRPNKK